jgi:hypothetical protein
MSSKGRMAVALCAALISGMAVAGVSAPVAGASASAPLAEVQVTASRLEYRRTLKVVAMKFVRAHAAPSGAIHQLGRWRESVCPVATGLEPRYDEFVTREIETIAQSVGAPTRGVGKRCRGNVEIVFTPQPQALLEHIARRYPTMLGSTRKPHGLTFEGAIESWYLSGTRATNGYNPPVLGLDAAPTGDMQVQAADTAPLGENAQVDSPDNDGFTPGGLAGSHLGVGLRSEFLYVLIVVDTHEVSQYSLRSVADYVAVLALTRMSSLDTCGALPSIIDLLADGCGERSKPDSITAADTAYLKALYASDLDMNLNLEEGEVRDLMVKSIDGR